MWLYAYELNFTEDMDINTMQKVIIGENYYSKITVGKIGRKCYQHKPFHLVEL